MGLRRESKKRRRDFSLLGIYETVLDSTGILLIETADPYIFEVLCVVGQLYTVG